MIIPFKKQSNTRGNCEGLGADNVQHILLQL